jgi:REP element-mobilizing transposase RayT
MMKFDPHKHHRRSTRLQGYDYTQHGAYFVTLCTHGRECLFGEIVNQTLVLNQYGEVVRDEWQRTAVIRPEVDLDVFVVMPNHLHFIVVITTDTPPVGAHGGLHPHGGTPLPTPASHANTLYRAPRSLGSLIAGFKSASTKRINILRATPGAPVWQRGYYDQIVQGEPHLNQVRQYILSNPANWSHDSENPARQ